MFFISNKGNFLLDGEKGPSVSSKKIEWNKTSSFYDNLSDF